MTKPKTVWRAQQISAFVADAMSPFGAGWKHIGARFQRAVICEKAIAVVRSQDRDDVSMLAIDELVERMLVEAGLA